MIIIYFRLVSRFFDRKYAIGYLFGTAIPPTYGILKYFKKISKKYFLEMYYNLKIINFKYNYQLLFLC